MTAIIAIIILLLLLFLLRPKEHYRVAESEYSEFVPPDMSLKEYRKATKWIYPGYLNDD